MPRVRCIILPPLLRTSTADLPQMQRFGIGLSVFLAIEYPPKPRHPVIPPPPVCTTRHRAFLLRLTVRARATLDISAVNIGMVIPEFLRVFTPVAAQPTIHGVEVLPPGVDPCVIILANFCARTDFFTFIARARVIHAVTSPKRSGRSSSHSLAICAERMPRALHRFSTPSI